MKPLKRRSTQFYFVLRRIARFTGRFIGAVLILIMLLLLLFQLPSVQKGLLNHITQSIENRSGGQIAFENAHLSFFNLLLLDNVLIKDNKQDTLLAVGRLKAKLSLASLVDKKDGYLINSITLNDGQVSLTKAAGDSLSNIAIFIESLSNKDKNKEKSKFDLDLKYLELNNILFSNVNEDKGNQFNISLPKGKAWLNEMSLTKKTMDVKRIALENMEMEVISHPAPIDSIQQVIEEIINDTGDTFKAGIGSFTLKNGKFKLHNYAKAPIKTSPDDELDFKHLEVNDINIAIHGFCYFEEVFSGYVEQLSGISSSGFQVNNLSVEDASVSPKAIHLNGLLLETPNSLVSDTLSLKYSKYADFTEFVDKVRIKAQLRNSNIALKDIMAFAPKLNQNQFFAQNKNTVLYINADILGRINSLRGKDMFFSLADGTEMEGSFSSFNLTEKDEAIMSMKLKKLNTSMTTLRQLIPNFNLPENFNRLGRLTFKGNFDGFFTDFVAYGSLDSDLGFAEMDMRLDISGGMEKAEYSGKLGLSNFDLGKWSGNPDFGIVTFSSQVKNGKSLRSDAAANLNAQVKSFVFKNYDYQNAELVGKLNKNLFDGDFSIKDRNIDLNFIGAIDFTKEIPVYDFKVDIKKFDLNALNLSQQQLALAGKIDLNLRNKKIADLIGKATIKDLAITKDTTTYLINKLEAISKLDTSLVRDFTIESEIMNAQINGNFNIDEIPAIFSQYFNDIYPQFTERINLKKPTKTIDTSAFVFQLSILDSKGLNWLVSDQLGLIKNATIGGHFNGFNKALDVKVKLPQFQFDQFLFEDIAVDLEGDSTGMNIFTELGHTIKKEKSFLNPIHISTALTPDSISLSLEYESKENPFFGNLELSSTITLPDSTHTKIHFGHTNLFLMEAPWIIDPQNEIIFDKKKIKVEHLALSHLNRKITIDDINQTGLKIEVENMDFGYIDEIWEYPALDFKGNYNIDATIDSIFQLKGIHANIHSDDLYVYRQLNYLAPESYGELNIKIDAKDLKSQMFTDLKLEKGEQTLNALATLNLQNINTGKKQLIEKSKNYVDIKIHAEEFPVHFSKFFIAPAVQDIEGTAEIDLNIFGHFPKPSVTGDIYAKDGAFTIDYLKTRYSFDNSHVKASTFLFDATGTIIKDKLGNTAEIIGGLTHHHLKNMGVSAQLSTNKFLALDTKKGDNDLYYGTAIGNGDVYFDGLFTHVDIYVNASAGEGTHIIMPISYDKSVDELTNVNFVNKRQQQNELANIEKANQLEGVSFEMDLVVDEAAIIEMIFDEKLGDILKGQGRGNLRIVVPRGEDFQMYGDYIISKGDYLFTLYDAINKAFSVQEGGHISWTGDPFGAQIDITAQYKDLKASLYTFLIEYLAEVNEDLIVEAQRQRPVDLYLFLDGDLLHPNINFDIAFEQIPPELLSYVDNKLRILKQDQNELNRQVFGLIVFGQFLPEDLANLSNINAALFNTLSELVTNQFSLLLNQWVNETFGETELFKDLNFDIAYSQYQSQLTEGKSNITDNAVEVMITKNFLNNRLSVQVGGDFGFGDASIYQNSGGFRGNDIIVEYVLNKNRTLKLKVYQKLEPTINGGNRLEIGTGITFRKEFNSFKELFSEEAD